MLVLRGKNLWTGKKYNLCADNTGHKRFYNKFHDILNKPIYEVQSNS